MTSENEPTPSQRPPVGIDNTEYVESLYQQWKADPDSVEPTWHYFFQGFEFGLPFAPAKGTAASGGDLNPEAASAQSRVASLIYAYRNLGHQIADINPLKDPPANHPDLEIGQFGLAEADLQRTFDTGHLQASNRMSLAEIIDVLKETYCGHIGVQYLHIQDVGVRRWLQGQMEPSRNQPGYDRVKKLDILSHLTDAEMFESFIQTRYPGQKRFSLEGAETLIPAVHALVEMAPEVGIKEMVIGMAHRGRLNILANILDKSYAGIFSEFEGTLLPDAYGGDGDVKYHKGFSSEHRNRFGRSVHLSLTANPSHLEAVNPVVLGRVRAKQRQHDDIEERGTILGLLIHGDAAFAGQGLVSETLEMSQLRGYRTGGSVHIIVNNQIGFTTNPSDARSTAYCTDVAKMIDAPIFHVNGDDPEAVVYAVELALRFRQEFKQDVVVDMLCYRRHGHNEGDEPSFTQPNLYAKIKKHPSSKAIYTDRLLAEGILTGEDANKVAENFQTQLQRHFEYARTVHPGMEVQAFDKLWQGLEQPYSTDPVDTSIGMNLVEKVGRALTTIPEGFNLHRKIARMLEEKKEILEKRGAVDWSFAEALAFGSLLEEGTPVRLSGQDSERGTFSQRHSTWIDNKSEEKYHPLNGISGEQAHFCVYNSPLNEASVLGFEYGYSLAEPRMLVIWEAQFGDFANGAQVIIDQFITSSQSKWQRTSGLVMLLPHGWEGQGPEHSNAYLERYLAACAQDNIQVCNLTTPGQYFHLLRRQIKRPFRRPLIVMAPKSMLRHKRAVSPLKELTDGGFQEIIDDTGVKVKDVRRLVLCSGKVYWDLLEKREAEGVGDVALIRVEQFYPLRNDLLTKFAHRYKNAEEILWVQEEPKNRGGWAHMRPVLQHLFPELELRYVGRGYAASPATGSLKRHKQEQETLVATAILGEAGRGDEPVLPESIEKEAREPSAA